jgi:hypothetical protein
MYGQNGYEHKERWSGVSSGIHTPPDTRLNPEIDQTRFYRSHILHRIHVPIDPVVLRSEPIKRIKYSTQTGDGTE